MSEEREFNNLPQWLPPRIRAAGYDSVEDFARACKISRASMYFYIQGEVRPDTQAMAKICHLLGERLEDGLRQYSPAKPGRPKKR